MSSTLLAACGWFHDGPSGRDIDAAVRRSLDAENHGPLNTLLGQPMPVSADVASVTRDGDCVKAAERTYACNVIIVLREAGQPAGGDTGRRVALSFVQDNDGAWQTSNVDTALATSAAKSLIDQIGRAFQDGPASAPASAPQ